MTRRRSSAAGRGSCAGPSATRCAAAPSSTPASSSCTTGRSFSISCSCSPIVSVETTTRSPRRRACSAAGSRYASDLPVPVPASTTRWRLSMRAWLTAAAIVLLLGPLLELREELRRAAGALQQLARPRRARRDASSPPPLAASRSPRAARAARRSDRRRSSIARRSRRAPRGPGTASDHAAPASRSSSCSIQTGSVVRRARSARNTEREARRRRGRDGARGSRCRGGRRCRAGCSRRGPAAEAEPARRCRRSGRCASTPLRARNVDVEFDALPDDRAVADEVGHLGATAANAARSRATRHRCPSGARLVRRQLASGARACGTRPSTPSRSKAIAATSIISSSSGLRPVVSVSRAT